MSGENNSLANYYKSAAKYDVDDESSFWNPDSSYYSDEEDEDDEEVTPSEWLTERIAERTKRREGSYENFIINRDNFALDPTRMGLPITLAEVQKHCNLYAHTNDPSKAIYFTPPAQVTDQQTIERALALLGVTEGELRLLCMHDPLVKPFSRSKAASIFHRRDKRFLAIARTQLSLHTRKRLRQLSQRSKRCKKNGSGANSSGDVKLRIENGVSVDGQKKRKQRILGDDEDPDANSDIMSAHDDKSDKLTAPPVPSPCPSIHFDTNTTVTASTAANPGASATTKAGQSANVDVNSSLLPSRLTHVEEFGALLLTSDDDDSCDNVDDYLDEIFFLDRWNKLVHDEYREAEKEHCVEDAVNVFACVEREGVEKGKNVKESAGKGGNCGKGEISGTVPGPTGAGTRRNTSMGVFDDSDSDVQMLLGKKPVPEMQTINIPGPNTSSLKELRKKLVSQPPGQYPLCIQWNGSSYRIPPLPPHLHHHIYSLFSAEALHATLCTCVCALCEQGDCQNMTLAVHWTGHVVRVDPNTCSVQRDCCCRTLLTMSGARMAVLQYIDYCRDHGRYGCGRGLSVEEKIEMAVAAGAGAGTGVGMCTATTTAAGAKGIVQGETQEGSRNMIDSGKMGVKPAFPSYFIGSRWCNGVGLESKDAKKMLLRADESLYDEYKDLPNRNEDQERKIRKNWDQSIRENIVVKNGKITVLSRDYLGETILETIHDDKNGESDDNFDSYDDSTYEPTYKHSRHTSSSSSSSSSAAITFPLSLSSIPIEEDKVVSRLPAALIPCIDTVARKVYRVRWAAMQ